MNSRLLSISKEGGGINSIWDVTEGDRLNLQDIENWMNGMEVVRELNVRVTGAQDSRRILR